MDESASASSDVPSRGLGGGFARLAIRPKDSSEQTDDDVRAGALGAVREEPDQSNHDDGGDDGSSPLPVVVTRRSNSQQIRQLMLPPSIYVSPPVALFAVGDNAAIATATGGGGDSADNDVDDAHVDEEIAVLRSLARASARAQRTARRPPRQQQQQQQQQNVRGCSSRGGMPFAFSPVPSTLGGVLSGREGLNAEVGLEMAMALRTQPFPATAAVFPSNRTLAGRVGKPEIGRFRRPVLMRQHRPPPPAADATGARSGAGRVERGVSVHRAARRATRAVEPLLVLATILVLPGFDFGFDAERLDTAAAGAAAAENRDDGQASAAATDNDDDAALVRATAQLARAVLGHPAVVRRCGRAPHRRGVARFLVLLLTFPLVAHHGKAAFEQACGGGYTPGDEHRPAFWAQYAAGFAAWLGLVDSHGEGGSSGDSDPFLGGTILQTLVRRLSEARRRCLETKAQQQQLLSSSSSSTGGSETTTEDEDMGEPMGMDADADADANADMDTDADDADTAASTASTGSELSVLIARLRREHRNTQHLPVSKAVDAWLLFVARRHDEEIDPALLAELSLE